MVMRMSGGSRRIRARSRWSVSPVRIANQDGAVDLDDAKHHGPVIDAVRVHRVGERLGESDQRRHLGIFVEKSSATHLIHGAYADGSEAGSPRAGALLG